MYSNIPWSICVGCTSNHIKESRSKGGWHSPSWWERLRLLLQDSGNVVQGTQIFIQSLFELGDRNYAWPSEHLEYQMSSTCQKQVLKDSTDMFYTFFTLFHSINILLFQNWNMRFLEHEFLANLVRKLPGALNLANEYICRVLNQNGAASANATGKNEELCTLLSWEPAFSPIHRSAHAWMLPATGLQSNTNHLLQARKETPETSAAWILSIEC